MLDWQSPGSSKSHDFNSNNWDLGGDVPLVWWVRENCETHCCFWSFHYICWQRQSIIAPASSSKAAVTNHKDPSVWTEWKTRSPVVTTKREESDRIFNPRPLDKLYLNHMKCPCGTWTGATCGEDLSMWGGRGSPTEGNIWTLWNMGDRSCLATN